VVVLGPVGEQVQRRVGPALARRRRQVPHAVDDVVHGGQGRRRETVGQVPAQPEHLVQRLVPAERGSALEDTTALQRGRAGLELLEVVGDQHPTEPGREMVTRVRLVSRRAAGASDTAEP
jgi:hypothetical protein